VKSALNHQFQFLITAEAALL